RQSKRYKSGGETASNKKARSMKEITNSSKNSNQKRERHCNN
ncbi:2227_t:CDS:1, partial [Gigaspora rosea]